MTSSSRLRRMRWTAALAAVSTALMGVAALEGSASAASRGGDHPQTRHSVKVAKHKPTAAGLLPKSGPYSFLLKLDTPSTATRFQAVRASGTKAAASAAAIKQLGVVKDAQKDVVSELPTLKGKTSVLYRIHAVMAGVAVTTDVTNAQALAKLPGVTAVYPIAPKKPDTSYAVPFQGAPTAWEGDGSGQNLGQGVKVADIDTGLDYTHADFGGPGMTAAYEAAKAADTTAPAAGSYDPNKFDAADSYDLVGDDYQADDTMSDPSETAYQPVPHPDPNPLDCSPEYGGEGHGSHTAGIIAGYGVTKDGQTYTGAYNSTTVNTANAGDWEIGPGMAPKATLISYRVFGCTGSTNVVSEAIDRAMDPNGDGDTSDHADVINMSLGSDFGSPDDADAVESDLASKLGVTMSISMGNSYDEYDVGGSPGVAQRAITVAASVDASSVVDETDYTINGGAAERGASERSIAYDWATKPDLAGDVVLPDPSDDPTGCTPYTDPGAIAGKIVLLKWSDSDPAGIDGCGSAARGANAAAAGAIGFVFASDAEAFSAGITGDATIPGVLVAKSVGDEMKTAIGNGQTVTITGTKASAYTQNFPADNDKMTDFSSRGIRAAGNLKPDVAAVGASVFSVLPGSGTSGQNMSGTSMAAPMVSGLAALVRGKHADWNPEQVKADIMNTADKNLYVDGSADPSSARYAPMRVGAGRIDAASALSNSVLAYVANDPGAVSASFGPLAVTTAQKLTKTITVQNTGSSAVTYHAGYDQITAVPGVSYSVSPATVSVPAGSKASVTLTLSVPDAATLAKSMSYDPTKATTDNGTVVDPSTGLPVDVLAEASGNVTFTPASGSAPTLRVPAYAAPRPASTMSAPSQAVLDASGTSTLALSGQDFGWSDQSDPKFSLASAFELQATSPVAPKCSTTVTSDCLWVSEDSGADLADVGTASDSDFLYVAIATQGAHSTAAGKVEFDIYLDTNGDGTPDMVAYDTRAGNSDVFVEELVNLNTGDVVDDELLNGQAYGIDTAVYDSGVLVVPISKAKLGDPASVSYGVASFSSSSEDEVDEVGFDAAGDPEIPVHLDDPAITVSDDSGLPSPFLADQDGNSLAVSVDQDSYADDGGQGLLLVHYQNQVGAQAQVVSFRSASDQVAPDVALTVPAKATVGKPVTATATVTDPAGSSVGVPAGKVTLVDDAGNTVVPATTVGSDGTAALTFTPSAAGTLNLQAFFAPSGDSVYTTGHSDEVPLTVVGAPPSTKPGGGTPPIAKSAVTVTVKAKKKVHLHKKLKVKVTVAGGTVPTGSITLKVGKKTVHATLVGGKAVIKVKAKKRGKLRLVASYAGDATHLAGISKKVKVRVV